MAWTYDSLFEALTTFLTSDGDDAFATAYPIALRQAEERILHAGKVQPFRKVVDVANVNTSVMATLDDIMGPVSVTGPGGPLLFKETTWIDEVYGLTIPSASTLNVYALRQSAADQQQTEVILAPYPSLPTNMRIIYFGKPPSLIDSPAGTWISINCENALFYGCLFNLYIYEKGEADMIAKYQEEFEKALSLLKGFSYGSMRRDQNRPSPQPQPES